MQSVRALSGRIAATAFPRLFAAPVKVSRKNRRPAQALSAQSRGGRKVLKIERPTWRDKYRKGEAPTRLALIALAGFYALTGLTGLVLGDLPQAFSNGVQTAFSAAARGVGLGIREIRIEGGSRLTDAEVAGILDITPATSSLNFNVEATRQRFLDIPWIKSASVRLSFPGMLSVNVSEREPYALWQSKGSVTMLDREGRSIGPYSDTRFSSLPLIVGAGADTQATQLLKELERYPALQSRLRAAIYVANRRWNLKLVEGTDIKLPEQDYGAALAKLAELDKKEALLNRDITVVDLRLPDRVIVRLTEEAAKTRDERLKEQAKSARAGTGGKA